MLNCTIVLLLIGVAVYSAIILEGIRDSIRCAHDHTRCIHGDEINAAARRTWFLGKDIICRQRCMSCGTALDRPAICSTLDGYGRHEWKGPWIPEHV